MKTPARNLLALTLWCALAALLAACRAPDESRWPRLTILVAEDAAPYAAGLAGWSADYRWRMGVLVSEQRLPPDRMLQRLGQSPPPDLVMTCDPALVRTMIARGMIEPERWLMERKRDRLALAAPRASNLQIQRIEDLDRPEAAAIGVTDILRSSTGVAASALLWREGISKHARDRLRIYKTKADLVRGLRRGEVAAGFFRESALGAFNGEFKPLLAVDPEPGRYPPYVAVAATRRSAHPVLAHQCWCSLEAYLRDHKLYLAEASPAGNIIRPANLEE